jgi:hypothetical protein
MEWEWEWGVRVRCIWYGSLRGITCAEEEEEDCACSVPYWGKECTEGSTVVEGKVRKEGTSK